MSKCKQKIHLILKRKDILKTLLGCLLLVITFGSCSKAVYNYSDYPEGTILKGEMNDGRILFLIRENDSTDISGSSLIHADNAIANLVPYSIDTFGTIHFNVNDTIHKGKIKLNKKRLGMLLKIPRMLLERIEKHKMQLDFWDVLEGKLICEPKYNEQSFDSIIAIKNIQYGMAPGFYTSEPIDSVPLGDTEEYRKIILRDVKQATAKRDSLPLLMDMYRPFEKNLTRRPVFLFIHGGGFFLGDKENMLQHTLAEDIVKRGYVFISIDYRLGSTIFGVKSVEKLIYSGMQDTRAALRYITHHSEELGIDPYQIYIGGSSAGAIIALNTAYMDDDEIFRSAERRIIRRELGGINDSGNDLKNRYSIAGVVSMWGAITDLNIIDGRNADIPVILFHGTVDNVVPIDSGLPFQERLDSKIYNRISTNWKLYGSESIYDHMKQLGMPVKFFSFKGYSHEPQRNKDGSYNENIVTIKREMNNFLYKNGHSNPGNYFISGDANVYPHSKSVYTVENGTGLKIKWNVEGGLIINRTVNSVRVIWYNTHKEGKISACITGEFGDSEQVEMRVKIHAD